MKVLDYTGLSHYNEKVIDEINKTKEDLSNRIANATNLDGLIATVDELNYCDGLTSNIQDQIDNKSDADHVHDYIPLSGSDSVTGTIRTTGEFQSTSANGIRLAHGGRGAILRNDGTATYVLLTNENDPYGSWNNLRPVIIDNATGIVRFENGLKGNITGNLTGNADTATNATTANSSKTSTTSSSISSSGYGNGTLTYLQTSSDFNDNTGWCHYLIANHGNGETYYNYMIGLPFYTVPMYRRQMGNENAKTPWHKFYTSENVTYGTNELSPGSSGLATGSIYLQYE